jgi:hypothetical protein
MRLIVTFVTILLMGLTIVEQPPTIAATKAAKLMVLYSNNVNGETEPCG